METIRATVICAAQTKQAAQAICTAHGDGPGTFSVALSTEQGVTNPALATHYAMSGQMSAVMVNALDVNMNPMFKAFPLEEGQTFDDHLAMCVPPLYRIYEEL